jgi:(S)-2-hydroxy-acid oxidase
MAKLQRLEVSEFISQVALHQVSFNPTAAAKENVVAIFSTIGTASMEEVAAAAPNSIRWFQLYIYKDRKLTESIVRRAENSGFKALVLTVDAPLFGLRRLDLRNKFSMPPHLTLANFQDVVTSMGGKSNS